MFYKLFQLLGVGRQAGGRRAQEPYVARMNITVEDTAKVDNAQSPYLIIYIYMIKHLKTWMVIFTHQMRRAERSGQR